MSGGSRKVHLDGHVRRVANALPPGRMVRRPRGHEAHAGAGRRRVAHALLSASEGEISDQISDQISSAMRDIDHDVSLKIQDTSSGPAGERPPPCRREPQQ